jgi:hypothetical protein
MSLLRSLVTPWVRDYLRAYPDEAMAVESLRLTGPDGQLGLFARSARGPFTAIIHTPGGPQDGYRGGGRTVLEALTHALAKVEVAA